MLSRINKLQVLICRKTLHLAEPSHPKAKELNENIMSFVKGIGHYSDGNKVAKDMYESLPMPASDLGFGPVTKIWWNRDGLVDDSEDGGKGDLVMKHTLTLQTLVSS